MANVGQACPERSQRLGVRLPRVKIVVLVKQVPRPDSIEFNEETKSLKREGVPLELNPFDVAAVRHAARLRDGSWYGRQLGHGEGYVYPHDDPRGFELSHLPEELQDRTYYRPSGNGEEVADDG